jgi:hypothetical protein
MFEQIQHSTWHLLKKGKQAEKGGRWGPLGCSSRGKGREDLIRKLQEGS